MAHVEQALAADDRTAQPGIAVHVQGNEIVLTGRVQTRERREAIEAVVRVAAPHHLVVNDTEVCDLGGRTDVAGRSKAIHVAAVGDIHFGTDSAGQLRSCLTSIDNEADILLLAGDLTRHGTVDEAAVLAEDLADCPVPVVAVLGNHDCHSDQQDSVAERLSSSGVEVLEGTHVVVDINGVTVGVAGTKGFGGGFPGACGSAFGEPVMKAFVAYSRELAEQLEYALTSLDTDVRIALTHFSPVEETLRGERLEIYPFLGSYFLAEAIDAAGCDFAFHGHAHAGTEVGITPGGVPVRNVAQPVIQQSYKVYPLTPSRAMAPVAALSSGA